MQNEYTEQENCSNKDEFIAKMCAGTKLSSLPRRGYTLVSMDTKAVFNEVTQEYDATCVMLWRRKTRVKKDT